VCLAIDIDAKQISHLITQSGDAAWSRGEAARGFFVGELDVPTQDAVLRLARLLVPPAPQDGDGDEPGAVSEYARMFGAPPIRDVAGLRKPAAASTAN
jgi:hypothetical protein